jgi:hypothetical protein
MEDLIMRASEPQLYVNFSTRLTLETHKRRRRLERAHGLSTVALIETALRQLENSIGGKATDEAAA